MSTYLWKYYFQDDVDTFRQILANASFNTTGYGRPHTSGRDGGTAAGSPGKGLSSSPATNKGRKSSGHGPGGGGSKGHKAWGDVVLTRADINARDAFGITLLHHIASSANEAASDYALALLGLHQLDLYAQDLESGWTALHRALYFGNITIARSLMNRDIQDTFRSSGASGSHTAGGLIKIKDREGNSPFDVYGATITNRILRHGSYIPTLPGGIDEDDDEMAQGDSGDKNEDGSSSRILQPRVCINGDELFTFGSNKNMSLGFGDEDDRQFPERINLKRPEHLLRRLYVEHQTRSLSVRNRFGSQKHEEPDFTGHRPLPALVQFQPITIQDIQLSKFHTAVLTTDPEANLYMCGFGPGGRLGTGDERTRFQFTCIYGGGLDGKKVVSVGLGQNHTVAISSQGETFTWGSNAFGQLGYAVPATNVKDEEPMQLLPRQIFGPLKREIVIGAAASRIHSAVHTSSALYTFGKNDGQLGLVDSDARSLEFQVTPRRVAATLFSSTITMVSAIEKATICLLDNHDVWIFANYGYTKMSFPLDSFSNYFLKDQYMTTRYDNTPNHISKISAGGDTICAMASAGDVFTVTVSQKTEPAPATTSTTNPSKIRSALSAPHRVWSLRKLHMAVRDVDVGQDGSVIICTEAGSVWRRVKRAKIKDANAPVGNADYKPKDYKFSRIPGLTRVIAVRSNAFGAFAAVRLDCDVLKTQVNVTSNTLWTDLFPLLPFHNFSWEEDSDTEEPTPRLWAPQHTSKDPATIRQGVLMSKNLEEDLAALFLSNVGSESSANQLYIGTTVSDVRIPCHDFLLAARSSVIRRGIPQFRQSYYFGIPEVLTIEYGKDGNPVIMFQGLDFLTILNLVLYTYTDSIVDVWHHTRHSPESTFRYRQVRIELMRVAAFLEIRGLEQAARSMTYPAKSLHHDMDRAIQDSAFFETGDVEIELHDTTVKVHSALMCQRCPFFEGLFNGRAGGRWLASRREQLEESEDAISVDLQHVESSVFRLVLEHLYADTGEEIFDDIVSEDLDAFLDFVMDVLAVANELMLDRLAQTCQKMLARFVNTRNVCQLLNAVAPCSVTEFKDAALEYICLNLEGMLENHLLDELEDDLMLELDEVVRQNQLACLPISKSGRAEADLLERHPELIAFIERSKRAKVDSMALRSHLHEDEIKFSNASKTRGNLAQSDDGELRLFSPGRSSGSPSLKAKASATDLMFVMDEDAGVIVRQGSSEMQPSTSGGKEPEDLDLDSVRSQPSSLHRENIWYDSKGRTLPSPSADAPHAGLNPSVVASRSPHLPSLGNSTVGSLPRDGAVWRSTTLATPKLDMKNIMAQASLNQESNISSALSQSSSSIKPVVGPKLSQKERKRQLQQQQLNAEALPPSPEIAPLKSTLEQSSSPWRIASASPRLNLKDVLGKPDESPYPSPASEKHRSSSNPGLTLRQTVAGSASGSKSPSTLPQTRSTSSPIIPQPKTPTTASTSSRPHPLASTTSTPTIQSIRHNTSKAAEPTISLSIADILSQQQTEKDLIKEAVAKRSLQEIQEEQAFAEWWDAESKKVQEEEAAAAAAAASKGGKGRGGGSSRGGRGKGRGGGASNNSRGGRGRGRGRGGNGGGEGSTSRGGKDKAFTGPAGGAQEMI
ncbi:MAG: hypothetical protein MMC33_009489 [Icmadophila ericetorum]|nr:hypothetical protein [Icmadophila ericetorum]